MTSSFLNLYSDEGDEQLSFTIGKDVNMFYEDINGLPEENNLIPFKLAVDDNE